MIGDLVVAVSLVVILGIVLGAGEARRRGRQRQLEAGTRGHPTSWREWWDDLE